MSRAYRIQVADSLTKVVKADDHVSSQLEVLGILPKEQMADLLGIELKERGFEVEGTTAKRTQDGVDISVDLATGEVVVQSEGCREVEVSSERQGTTYDDYGPGKKALKKSLEEELQKDLEEKVDQKREKLQSEITDQLEGQLHDIRKELESAVNRATAEALKQKAASMGQIKEIAEDDEGGSLTIVVEV